MIYVITYSSFKVFLLHKLAINGMSLVYYVSPCRMKALFVMQSVKYIIEHIQVKGVTYIPLLKDKAGVNFFFI